MVGAGIADDPRQPCQKPRIAAKGWQTVPDPQQNLLCQIGGVLLMPDRIKCRAEHEPFILADQLLKGMRLQLNSTQSLFRQNHRTQETFLRELMDARILQCCKDGFDNNKSEYKKNVGVKQSNTRIGNVCAIGTNDEYDIWPKGVYAQKFNRDEFSVVFFHITTIRPFGFAGTIPTHYQVYNSRNDLIYDHEGTLQIQPDYDKISTGWILKGKDGTFVPSGDYTFVCSLNNSPDFSYPFTVVSDEEVKPSSFFGKMKSLFR